ncbi:DUF485 domain-containing protein [Methylobacterium sp. P31]
MSGAAYHHPANTSGTRISNLARTSSADADAAAEYNQIIRNPTFRILVHERTRFGWFLTMLMLMIYFGFIGLIAFDRELLATRVVGTATLGLFLGVGVIVLAFILTGLYVARANARFDALTRDLMRDLSR